MVSRHVFPEKCVHTNFCVHVPYLHSAHCPSELIFQVLFKYIVCILLKITNLYSKPPGPTCAEVNACHGVWIAVCLFEWNTFGRESTQLAGPTEGWGSWQHHYCLFSGSDVPSARPHASVLPLSGFCLVRGFSPAQFIWVNEVSVGFDSKGRTKMIVEI